MKKPTEIIYIRYTHSVGLNYMGPLTCKYFSIVNITVLHNPGWTHYICYNENNYIFYLIFTSFNINTISLFFLLSTCVYISSISYIYIFHNTHTHTHIYIYICYATPISKPQGPLIEKIEKLMRRKSLNASN